MRGFPARNAAFGARLLSVGTYRPAAELGNTELAERFGRTEQWMLARTGMRTRRIAGAEETPQRMAERAGHAALDASGVPADEVDVVIVASCSNANPVVPIAGVTAAAIGARRAGAFDLNSACAGFCYGLTLAADMIRTGSARHVLLIGAERMTSWVAPDDLGTAILFGDGAGAVVVGRAERPGIGRAVWGSDGSQASLIRVEPADGRMRMDGQSVFRWATTQIAPVALRACERAGIAPRELAAIVPHQANLRIVDAVAQRIGAPDAAIARDGEQSGNTSAASIPIAMHRLLSSAAVAGGEPALLVGFGAGLTYAAQVVELPPVLENGNALAE